MVKLSNLEFFRKVAETWRGSRRSFSLHLPSDNRKDAGFPIGRGWPRHGNDRTWWPIAAIHANPLGTIHGGVLCDIADAAIGTAHATSLKEDESFTSIDLQINFFRPARNGRFARLPDL